MKFTFTYEPTSWNDFYKPYYTINNKRVSKEYFNSMIDICEFKGMRYNSSILVCGSKRYKSTFYYD